MSPPRPARASRCIYTSALHCKRDLGRDLNIQRSCALPVAAMIHDITISARFCDCAIKRISKLLRRTRVGLCESAQGDRAWGVGRGALGGGAWS